MAAQTFRLTQEVAEPLRAGLPAVAERVVAAIIAQVPVYGDPFRGGMGANIETAVRISLAGFLDRASAPPRGAEARRRQAGQQQRVRDAAYALGQGEARAGRSIEALTSAYGVGARVAWRDIGAGAITAGLAAGEVAQFAELVFAYINELSVLSINGHADELVSNRQIRQRRLERLCNKLLDGAPEADLRAAAKLAEWEPPTQLVAVLLPVSDAAATASAIPAATLQPSDDLPGLPTDHTVLLVSASGPRDRAALLAALGTAATPMTVGSARPWPQARDSYLRAVRMHTIGAPTEADRPTGPGGPVDVDEHLLELILGADPTALADLRDRVLAPLQTVSESSREKLAATLRAWLLHHGRRDEVARALFVHPQTVRYRVGQLRDLYGDLLTDPRFVLELTVALA